MKCEMLIMQLYPWLSIRETSTDAIASPLLAPPSAAPSSESSGHQQGTQQTQEQKQTRQATQKKGFFAKLFSKK